MTEPNTNNNNENIQLYVEEVEEQNEQNEDDDDEDDEDDEYNIKFHFKNTKTGITFWAELDIRIGINEIRKHIDSLVNFYFSFKYYVIVVAGKPGDEEAESLDENIDDSLEEYFGDSIKSIAFYIRPI